MTRGIHKPCGHGRRFANSQMSISLHKSYLVNYPEGGGNQKCPHGIWMAPKAKYLQVGPQEKLS